MNKPVIAGIAAGVLLVGVLVAALGITPSSAQAQPTGVTKKVLLVANEKVLQVAPDNALHPGGVMYNAMVFNGTIPAPVIAIDQGDTLQITLKNEGKVIHSLDFHAAIGPGKALSGNVAPGESKTWTMQGVSAGAFYYHCGADALNGVWEHIANGMYGTLVVHPINEKPAKEFYVSFGEIYSNSIPGVFQKANGTGSFDVGKFLADTPDLKLVNGEAFKYVPSVGQQAKIELNKNATVFKVKPGELTRWYINNGGPSDYVAFHFIAGQIDVRDGFVANRLMTQLRNDETWTIPPGSASVIETVFPDEGIYVGVDHAMVNVLKGGAFAVLATNNSTASDHPPGTWVAPKGSAVVAAPSPINATMTTTTSNTTTPTTPSTTTNATSGGNATTGNATSAGNTTSTGNTSSTGTTTPTSGVAPAAGGAGSTSASIVSGASSQTTTAFSPNPLNVKVGDTVTWTNDDSQPHTITSGKGSSDAEKGKVFDSSPNLNPLLAPKATFSHKFTAAGTVEYFCQLHPNMVGTVNVS
jgi:nitrite reductase (NO-forming)